MDALACNALGYQLIPGTVLAGDGFDTSTAPAFSAGWALLDLSGTDGNWITRTASIYPAGISPHSAPNMAVFNSFYTRYGEQTRLFQTGGIDLSGRADAEVSLWIYHELGYSSDPDGVQVQVSTDGGVSWSSVGAPIARYDGTTRWAKHTVNIDAFTGAGMTDVRVGLVGMSSFGNDVHLDDVAVSSATLCSPTPSTGLVIGVVYDANTNQPASTPPFTMPRCAWPL